MKRRDFLRWVCLTPAILAAQKVLPIPVESTFLCNIKMGKGVDNELVIGPFKVMALDALELEQKILEMDFRQLNTACFDYQQE